jgi:hypothetical protein
MDTYPLWEPSLLAMAAAHSPLISTECISIPVVTARNEYVHQRETGRLSGCHREQA